MIEFSIFLTERDNLPARTQGTWAQVARSLSRVRAAECEAVGDEECRRSECPHKYGPSWSPAVWPQGEARAKKTVEQVGLLVADLDHVPTDADLQRALDALGRRRLLIHGSHSDRPGDRCVRAIFALSRPVLASEWPRFWRAARQAGLPMDEQTKDASRIFFRPSRPRDRCGPAPDGTGYYFEQRDGDPLDVDLLLASVPVESPAPERRDVAQLIPVPGEEPLLEAVKLLAGAWPKSGRHRASLALTGALARMGWDAETIADFVAAVCEIQEEGNGDLDKRLEHAERAVQRVADGDNVEGWPTLITILGEEPVSGSRRALGIPEPGGDPDVMKFLDAPEVDAPREMSSEEVLDHYRAVRNRLTRAAGENEAAQRKQAEGRTLGKLISGDLLYQPSEPRADQATKIRDAIETLLRHAPRRTFDSLRLVEMLMGSCPGFPPETLGKLVEHFRQKLGATGPVVVEPKDDDELRSLLLMARDGPRDCGSNVELILRYADGLRGELRFDKLTKEVRVTGGPFEGEAANDLDVSVKNWLERQWGLFASITEVGAQILHAARKFGAVDPVREYLLDLRWDGNLRLGDSQSHPGWLETYCHAAVVDVNGRDVTQAIRDMGSRFMIAAVARALVPGAKVDTVLVFEGLQGLKKSTAFEILGGEWFTDTPLDISNKDSRLLAASRWMCELAELASIMRSDLESNKAFLVARKDDFRPPYGRVVEKFDRRCVFVGTVNVDKADEAHYLIDETGDRRWWPIRIRSEIDAEGLRRDRDQLWAEAVQRYQDSALRPELAHARCPGERWWFERKEQEKLDEITAERHAEDAWAPILAAWADAQSRIPTANLGMQTQGPPRLAWTLEEIARGALHLEAAELKKQQKFLGTALAAAGFRRTRPRRDDGKQRRLWTREVTADKILVDDDAATIEGCASPPSS